MIPLRVQWYGLATTLLAEDAPLLELCARSGCRGLLIGFESISTPTLRGIHKGFNEPGRYGEIVERFHERGISVQGCFVFGHDHDTPEVFLETARFVVEWRIDLPRFAVLTPFPGTALFKRLEEEGRILTRNWELYDAQHVVFQPARMSIDDLLRGTQAAWRFAYSGSSILRRLWKTPAPLHVAAGANLAYRFYGRNLHRFYTCDWPIGARQSPRPASGFRPPSAAPQEGGQGRAAEVH